MRASSHLAQKHVV